MYKLPHAQLVRRSSSVGRCFFFALTQVLSISVMGKDRKSDVFDVGPTASVSSFALLPDRHNLGFISTHLQNMFSEGQLQWVGRAGSNSDRHRRHHKSLALCPLSLSLSVFLSYLHCLGCRPLSGRFPRWPCSGLACASPAQPRPQSRHNTNHAIALSAMETDCSGHARAVP